MNEDHSKTIIAGLIKSLEDGIVLAAAQKAVIANHVGSEWDSQIAASQRMIRGSLASTFEQLRDMLLSTSPGIPLQADWLQVVQRLVDSVAEEDPGGK